MCGDASVKLFPWVSQIWTNRWAKAVLLMAAAAAVTFCLVEFLFPIRIPPALRGKWVVAEGDLKGDTLEIFRDGAMIAKKKGTGDLPAARRSLNPDPTPDQAADATIIRGTIRVRDNTLRITTTHPLTGDEVIDSQTILDLTEYQLVVEDEHGELLIMRRTP